MAKTYLFSYGTLQQERVQIQLFGRIFGGARDKLEGWRAAFVEIKDEVFLLKGEDRQQLIAVLTGDLQDSISGTVFEVLPRELLLADRYEPARYERIKVQLYSGKEAWIYAAAKSDFDD